MKSRIAQQHYIVSAPHRQGTDENQQRSRSALSPATAAASELPRGNFPTAAGESFRFARVVLNRSNQSAPKDEDVSRLYYVRRRHPSASQRCYSSTFRSALAASFLRLAGDGPSSLFHSVHLINMVLGKLALPVTVFSAEPPQRGPCTMAGSESPPSALPLDPRPGGRMRGRRPRRNRCAARSPTGSGSHRQLPAVV